MSKRSSDRGYTTRYNEDGLRVTRGETHGHKLAEKRMQAALHRKNFDIVPDEEDDDAGVESWFYQMNTTNED